MAQTKKKVINRDLCRVLTPEFRVSYPHVFKPSKMEGTSNALKYSIGMLFPKNSDLSSLKEAMKQAKIAQFGSKENWPDDLASPVTDGDDKKHDDKEGYKGHWVMRASSNEDQKPGVVDEDVEPILEQSKFYPGCYARAYVLAYVWEFPKGSGKFGVGFILDHVQKMRDGKPFGGKKPVDQVFTPVNTGQSEDFEETESEDFR
jgi:Protein of unknown function (DUF2815)